MYSTSGLMHGVISNELALDRRQLLNRKARNMTYLSSGLPAGWGRGKCEMWTHRTSRWADDWSGSAGLQGQSHALAPRTVNRCLKTTKKKDKTEVFHNTDFKVVIDWLMMDDSHISHAPIVWKMFYFIPNSAEKLVCETDLCRFDCVGSWRSQTGSGASVGALLPLLC